MSNLSLYQEVIARTRYARWDAAKGRRENWDDSVSRYFDFFAKYLADKHEYAIINRKALEKSVADLDVMPSMRALMTAGPALEAVQVANYNCSYLPIDSVRALPEMMYILMSGGGVGFSVERAVIGDLPYVPSEFEDTDYSITVADSREGWCKAYHKLLAMLWGGYLPKWDVSNVRPAGARLKTFGGYASGPEPLEDLFKHTVRIFGKAKGRRLKSTEVFSLATYVAQIVVVGGVRRSATICLFDSDDLEMRNVKGVGSNMYYVDEKGNWKPGANAHFAMANISAVYEQKPTVTDFMGLWSDLIKGQAGEPGLFNRAAFRANAEACGRANKYANGEVIQWGANPCCEIQLRPYQMCNLTGVAIRPEDTLEDLKRKVRHATILGTWQACVSDFSYLRKSWQANVEEERLLGVCLSGFYDHPVLSTTSEESGRWLRELRELSWAVNKEIAADIGIPASTCVTSVKPAGNSGELYDTASGIHPRWSHHYVRAIRQSNTDPMTQFLKDQGVPHEPSVQEPERDTIFYFPQKGPETSTIFRKDLTAIQQLDHWLHVKDNWATHTVSCTVYVRDDEWLKVGAWVYDNFDKVTGLSFLPYTDSVYKQAPYTEVTEEQYNKLCAEMPTQVDWNQFARYDLTDTTKVGQEFTCVGGACTL